MSIIGIDRQHEGRSRQTPERNALHQEHHWYSGLTVSRNGQPVIILFQI